MANTIKRMHAERSGCDVKKRIVRPDGEQRYIRCVGISVVEGEVLKGFLGTAIDITDQELLTHELERRQAHLTEAQKLTHTGSWAWRVPGWNAVEVSEEFYRIFGFDPAEGAPTREKYLQRLHPEDRVTWTGITERAIAEKADYDHEFRILLPNGKVKWIRTVGHPVFPGPEIWRNSWAARLTLRSTNLPSKSVKTATTRGRPGAYRSGKYFRRNGSIAGTRD